MHIKGKRFGLPIIRRIGILKHHETYRVSWNCHDGIEIHYVLKGDIGWELCGTKSPLTVSGGSFGIIPAHARHRALDDNGTPAVRLGVIFKAPSAEMTEGTPFSADDLTRIFGRIQEHCGCVRRFSPSLAAALHELVGSVSLESVKEPDGQLHLRLLFARILYETFVALDEPEPLSDGHDVIPQICAWLQAHYAEKIAIPRLVRLSGYGRSRFFSLFLTATGMTPNDYLVRIRIEKAKEVLSKSADSSILDVAVSCGFNSAAAFSSAFRKHVGVSPRRFRRV